MPVLERSLSSSSSSSSSTISVGSGDREIDPLLNDLDEKKQKFRRNVVSLASELKEARARLSSQRESFAKESLSRQEAENRAKTMEQQICRLHRTLEDKNSELQASASTAEQYLKDLGSLRSQLAATQTTADASAASAQSAQLLCLTLVKELESKASSLKEHEDRVTRLGEQVDSLRKDLEERESSQKQLKDEVLRIEHDIMQAVASAGDSKDCELRKILDEVSPKNLEKINKLISDKDDEIVKLRDEIRVMSAHWNLKTKDLESQLEKQKRADQELKKRVLKLEFCLQEARSQTRKLIRMGDRRDKAIKELQNQLAAKQAVGGGFSSNEKHNFWENSSFKILASMSMLVLVIFSKR